MIEESMIAPCGMNCAICSRHLALKNETQKEGVKIPYCEGCRAKEKKCAFQKKCPRLNHNLVKYCGECPNFPCKNLQKLDKRYRTYYHMSMIENLNFIKQLGLKKFLEREKSKWQCPQCGELRCCHNGLCFKCDNKVLKHKRREKLYRWEGEIGDRL
jgi:hypothetical protein